MRLLENSEVGLARKYFREAKKEAEKSPRYISKCGAVLVKNNIILGRGFNSLPKDKGLEEYFKDSLPSDSNSDGTSCIYAVHGAIDDALGKYNQEGIKGSTLYFTKLNSEKKIIPVEKPSCKICSKLVLDNGVSKLVLFHEFGFCKYDAKEYNDISLGLKEWKPES